MTTLKSCTVLISLVVVLGVTGCHGGGGSTPANNPAPTVTSVSPASTTRGAVAFTLTLDGTGFVNGSVVRWNATDRTTTFVSATQVTAAINAADVASAGTAAVTVFNPAPGGGTSTASTFTINNPAPVISALSPASVTAGAAAFTLTVTGAAFVNGSVVRWNGSDRTTTFVSATQLTAAVNAADIASAGTAAVTVFNPAPGGGTSAVSTVTISGAASTSGYFKASNPEASDNFGSAVALSGDANTLAVGACCEDSDGSSQSDNSALYAGAVYVFARNGLGWSQQAYLKASNAGANDLFGDVIALSADGNTLAVGASGEASDGSSPANNAANQAGAVYVFTRDPATATWTQQAYLKASNAEGDDSFGESVSLSADGNTLAVGATTESSNATGIGGNQSNNSAVAAGAVYVYTRAGSTWTQQAYVKASNTGADDRFGISVSLSTDGNTLAVGADQEASNATGIGGNQADNSAIAAGAVYIFTRTGSTWSQQAYVKATNAEARDNFGFVVNLSGDGNTLAVAAPGEDGNGSSQSDNSASNAGAEYVFIRSGSTWSQQAYLKASNAEANDIFGFSSSLSTDGNTLAVTATQEDSNATGTNGNPANNLASNSGAAYVFTRSGNSWTQQSYVKASNTDVNDYFGRSSSLSADGSRLAVGADREDSNAVGVGANSAAQADNSAPDAGAVYLY